MKQLIDQNYIRKLVKDHIANAKKKNSLYSMRAFAKKIGVSVGGLSSFLSGKLDYSLDTLEKIINGIVASPEERKDILKEFNVLLLEQIKEKTKSSTYNFRVLEEEELSFIKDWYHYALLFLIRTKDFRLDILWISKRLGISTGEVEQALARLIQLNLITINQDQSITCTDKVIKTSDDVANQSLKIMHKQMLYLATQSIDNDSVDIRDITSLTLPINTKNLPKAKEILRKCQDDLMAILPDNEMNEVYHVLFSLYPVTKPAENE